MLYLVSEGGLISCFVLLRYGSGWLELCAVMYSSIHLGFTAIAIGWYCLLPHFCAIVVSRETRICEARLKSELSCECL